MDTYHRHEIGKGFEKEACEFLQTKGFSLLVKNYSCKAGEIDLIMQDKEDIVFVEVRSRHHTKYGSALESITKSKMNKIIRTATLYLQAKKWLHTKNSRFDVIAISPVDGEMKMEWIKNAFLVESPR